MARRPGKVASAGLALAAVSTWGVLATHDLGTDRAPWLLDAYVGTMVLATSGVVAAGVNRLLALLVYLFGWLALVVLLGGELTGLGSALLLLAWTAVVLWLGRRPRFQADAGQRALHVLLPMAVGGIAALVSAALLLSSLTTTVDGQSVTGLEAVVSAALPVLLAMGAILCGFRAARVVADHAIISRRSARSAGACAALLAIASIGQALWGFVPLATLALTLGGPLAVFALAQGIPSRPKSTRLSSIVAAAYAMIGLLAIGGAILTYAAAVAVTYVAHRVGEDVDGAGLIATPGAVMLGLAAGYLMWRAARERYEPRSR